MESYDLGYDYAKDSDAAKVARNGADLVSSYINNRSEVTKVSGLDAEIKTFMRRVREGSIIYELYDIDLSASEPASSQVINYLAMCRHSIARSVTVDNIEEAKEIFYELVSFGRKEFTKSRANFSLDSVFKSYLKFRKSNKKLRQDETAYISDREGILLLAKPKENFKLEMLVDPIASINETHEITRLRIKSPDYTGGVEWVFVDGSANQTITISNTAFYNAFVSGSIVIHFGDVITALTRTKITKMKNGKENKQRFLEAVLGVFSLKNGIFDEFGHRFIDGKSKEIIASLAK